MDEKEKAITPLAVAGTTTVVAGVTIDGMTGAVTLNSPDVLIADRSPTPSNIQFSQALVNPNPAGTFSNVTLTVDTKGRVTSASSGTPLTTFISPGSGYQPMPQPVQLSLYSINPNFNQMYGGFVAGKYQYCIGYQSSPTLLARVDISDFSTVQTLDLSIPTNYDRLWGGFSDGRYLYCLSYNQGVVYRVDLQNWTNTISTLNIQSLNSTINQFMTACTDGLYGYVSNWRGYLCRFSLANFTTTGVTILNLNPLVTLSSNYQDYCTGTDGKQVYTLWANWNNNNVMLTAVDVNNFTLGGSKVLNLSAYAGMEAQSFVLAGDYIYVITRENYNAVPIGNVFKISKDFSSVTTLNLAAVNSSYVGYFSGFTDPQERYLYLGPYSQNTPLVRVDLGDFQSVQAVALPSLAANGCGSCGAGDDGVFGCFLFNDYSTYNTTVVRIPLFDGGNW